MRSLLTAGLLAGLALASPALAQAPPGRQPAKAYDASTVLATVNGTEITLGHVIALRDRLPEQYQNLPDDVLMTGLARPAGRPGAARRRRSRPRRRATRCRCGSHVENERRGALAGLAASAAVADAVDDAKVRPPTTSRSRTSSRQPEFNAAHILVDSEEKAKALKAEIDGGKDFAEVAKANSTDGSAANGGELGWFGARADGAGVRGGGGGDARSAQVSEPVQDASSAGT